MENNIMEKYNDVFYDMVKCYLENYDVEEEDILEEDKEEYKKIQSLSSDDICEIAYRLIYKNEPMWEYINECIYYEIERLLELKEK